jgi:hypothetical protein
MKKTFLSCLLTFSLLLATAPMALAAPAAGTDAYGDIAGAWYEDAARAYAYPEIFDDGSGKLNPDKDITRIEFVRVLHRALGISIEYFAPNDIGDSFDDMTNDDAGANELIDLVTAGIVGAGGSFDPGAPLTREVMISWTIAALDYMTGGDYAMIMIAPAPFDDDAEIDPAYKDDVVKAVVLQLVNGRGGNRLYPTDGATRAEVLTVVYRLTGLIETLQNDVTVDATAAVAGEKLFMSLTIRNNTDKDVTIHYTSGQRFDFKLFDAGGASLYTWSADKQFLQALSDEVLEPGEQLNYTETLDSDAYGAIRDGAALLRAYITGASDDFEIDENGYEAVIESK